MLKVNGIILTDQNASRACRFMTLDAGLPLLKAEEVFAQFWLNKDDQIEEYRLKGVKCAEVLVPRSVDVNPPVIEAQIKKENIAQKITICGTLEVAKQF